MGTTHSNSLCLCLAPGDAVNHLDHLVVVSYIMNVPIVTDEASVYESLKRYYPQVKPIYIKERQRILEYLSERCDTLFVSCANYRRDVSPLLEMFFNKEMTFCYCPHGNSDKPMTQFELQNYSLIYGDQMEDRLNEMGTLQNLEAYVRTSNIRFPFYWKYEAFYDQIAEEEVFSKFDKKQPTILYAPTWQDMESSSSLFDVGIPIIDQLPDQYNLIVKLHPWLQHHHAGHVHLIKERYQDRANVTVLTLFPLVLPLLKRSDIYLGDFSSIGYDFLYFNRPMFFFDPSERERSREESDSLHSCGVVIPESAYQDIYGFLESHLAQQDRYKPAREKLYHYTFGEDRDFEELQREITDKIRVRAPSSDPLS
ncbi:MAG: putative CDP-glycerol:glycerophosphate glycerophosphotransferase [Chlamydiae bacterium]|nr:putative CDP-glycerol:glycerophosphate glycerophosphotransferase [Chlamydiota bacterium]